MSIKTKIVGVIQKNSDGTSRQELLKDLKRQGGKNLVLKHEPGNPVSNHAVAVYNSIGEQLGYLNDELAEELIDEIQEVGTVYAEVLNISGGGDGKAYGCNIEILYDDEDGLTEAVVPEDFGEGKASITANVVMLVIIGVFILGAFCLWRWLFG